jgi:hypothetical protein
MAGPLVALVLFFVVFVAITIRVLRTRADRFNAEAALPLSDVAPSGHAERREEPS